MAHQPDNVSFDTLALPGTADGTLRLAEAAVRPARWAERAIARAQPLVAVDNGAHLMRRFDTADAPGVWATTLAQRFVADTLAPAPTDLVLALYAPPQRHISTARQGALAWSGAATPTSWAPHDASAQQNSQVPMDEAPSAAPATQALARSTQQPATSSQPLLGDLEALGWGSGGSTVAPAGEQATPGHAAPLSVQALQRTSFASPPGVRHDDVETGVQEGEPAARPADVAAVPPFPTGALRVMRLIDSPQIDPLQRMGIVPRGSPPLSHAAQRLAQSERHEEPLAGAGHMVPASPQSGGEHPPLLAEPHVHRTAALPQASDNLTPVRLARWADQSMPRAQPDVASNTPAHAPVDAVGSDENGVYPTISAQPTLHINDPTAERAYTQEQSVSPGDAPEPHASAANKATPYVQTDSWTQHDDTPSTEEEGASSDWHYASPPAHIARSTTNVSSVQGVHTPRADGANSAVPHAQQTAGKHSAEHDVRRDAEPSSASPGGDVPQRAEGTTQHSTLAGPSFPQRTLEPFAAALVQRYAKGASNTSGAIPLASTRSRMLAMRAENTGGYLFSATTLFRSSSDEPQGASSPGGEQPSVAWSPIVLPFALPPNQHAVSLQRSDIDHAGSSVVNKATPATANVQRTAWQEAHSPSLGEAIRNTNGHSTTPQPMQPYVASHITTFPLLQPVDGGPTLSRAATFAAGVHQQFGDPWRETEQLEEHEHSAAHAMDHSIVTEQPVAPPALQLLRRAAEVNDEDETKDQSFTSSFTLLAPSQRQPAAGTIEQWPGPPLALLHPQRSIQRAPAPSEASTAPSTTSAHGASVAAGTKGGAGAKPDVDALARQVYARLRRRLLVERERMGR